jgi:hypothetical protein
LEIDTMTEPAASSGGIAWDHYRRWFLRGRVFRIAIQARLLLLGSLGVLLTIFGWWLFTELFWTAEDEAFRSFLQGYRSCPWTSPEGGPGLIDYLPGIPAPTVTPGMGHPPRDAVVDPWSRLSAPFRQFFDAFQTISGAAFVLLCAVWAAAVWGFVGGAITRSAVVQLTREEATPLRDAGRHVVKRWKSYFGAPLFPIIAVSGMAVPAMLIGLVMQGSLLVGGLLWPIALGIGLVSAILLVGLTVGWPLMHPAISAEGSDAFDALSRSYSYVYQRPLHYLFYAVSALVLGLLGLMVVSLFAGAVEQLAFWGVSWGSGAERAREAAAVAAGGSHHEFGAGLFLFWHGVIRLVVLGFAFAFFWTAATAIYLLLRYDADGADLNEVYLEDAPPVTVGSLQAKDATTEPKPTDA